MLWQLPTGIPRKKKLQLAWESCNVHLSCWKIACSAPQGSIARPMVFKSFINELDMHGQSTPSASLGRWYKSGTSGWHSRRSCCHSEGPQTGQNRNLEIQQREELGPAPGEEQPQAPGHVRGWPAKKDLGFLVDSKLATNQRCALMKRWAAASWAALGGTLPAGGGRRSFPSTRHWSGRIWSTGSGSGLPSAHQLHETISRGASVTLWPIQGIQALLSGYHM